MSAQQQLQQYGWIVRVRDERELDDYSTWYVGPYRHERTAQDHAAHLESVALDNDLTRDCFVEPLYSPSEVVG